MRDPALVDLERYLHQVIPLSQAMGVVVDHVGDDGVRLSMPLGPNLNHQGGLFGGSGVALAILAGWTMIHERLRRQKDLRPQLVIQRSAMEYLEPVTSDVVAFAPAPTPEAWERFLRTFRRRGRGRIQVAAELGAEGRPAARFAATYVALGSGEGARTG